MLRSDLAPLSDRGPLRVLFAINNLEVGGAEMLTYELVRRLDRERFAPEVACMRDAGELGNRLRREYPVHANLLAGKYDLRVLPRLYKLLTKGRFDAIITVGAGDRMFWGRLAARLARTPVVIAALHSTGWPDVVNRMNRMLTPWTDAFVGCAERHARYLREVERFPAERVHWIPNGVDTNKFTPQCDPERRVALGLPSTGPLVGLVAQLRPEKQHELFLEVARRVAAQVPTVHFVLVGQGQRREELERLTGELGMTDRVHFLGARSDVPQLLPHWDVFLLTSKMEANPVSILEAQSCGVPVVAVNVGSIPETVLPDRTGYLAAPGSADELTAGVLKILQSPNRRAEFGMAAREHVVSSWSLDRMVCGYEELLTKLYQQKRGDDLIPLSQVEAEFLNAGGCEMKPQTALHSGPIGQ